MEHDRPRLLSHIAGCHVRNVRESLYMARCGARSFAAERIEAAQYSARLAWRVAIALEAEARP